MRKILFLIFIVASLTGCKNTQNNKIASNNTELKSNTDKFVKFFKYYKERYYKAPNEIAEKEILKEREKKIMGLMDSLIILKNIKGQIYGISIDERSSGKSNVLRYKIDVGKEEYFCVYLECANLIKNEDDDYFYNRIKNYSNRQNVYFDGIISINVDKNLPKEYWSSDKKLTLSYPKYYFHIIDISSSPLTDTLDVNVRNAMEAGKECMDYLSAKFRKEKYDKKDYDKKSDEFNKLKKNLTENQKSYIKRYMDARLIDFVN